MLLTSLMSTSQIKGCLRKQLDVKYHELSVDDIMPQLSRVLIDTGCAFIQFVKPFTS